MRRTYDFVVVGAGSAGCVLAARLSADPANRVLLIEAGGADRHPMMAMPLAFYKLLRRPEVNWGFKTEPEPHADHRELPVFRGRALGGSSSINGMIYTRGHPRDYDQWAQLGNAGWGYDDVLPYFIRSETNWRGASAHHGGSGPLSVSPPPGDDELFQALAETARGKGYRVTDDFEAGDPEGFGMPDFTTHKGRRGSTAKRYLDPARVRPNLDILTEAHCTRLLFERKRANGVEYVRGGERHTVCAAREVILSAGAYNSPQLLMLSGIGPAEHLRSVGIEPVVDLPGVGRNLQEHPTVAMRFAAARPIKFEERLRFDRLLRSVLLWRLTGKGFAATLPLTAIAFVKSRPELERPDLEAMFLPTAMDARVWFPGVVKGRGHVITNSVIVLRPESRGSVELRSADPCALPKIRWNLLAEPSDRALLRSGLRWMRDFVRSPPLGDYLGDEVLPGPTCQSDEALDAHMRRIVGTAHHPTSSCAMGAGPGAVVDPQLRVYGVEGLRVADASIMPVIIGGHPNAPTIMIGEKASDIILAAPAHHLSMASAA